MKNYRSILLTILFLTTITSIQAKSTIILRINGSNAQIHQKIITQLLTIQNTTLEYSCNEVGLIIIKEDGLNMNNPREIKMYIKNLINKVKNDFTIELIEVIVESNTSTSNC